MSDIKLKVNRNSWYVPEMVLSLKDISVFLVWLSYTLPLWGRSFLSSLHLIFLGHSQESSSVSHASPVTSCRTEVELPPQLNHPHICFPHHLVSFLTCIYTWHFLIYLCTPACKYKHKEGIISLFLLHVNRYSLTTYVCWTKGRQQWTNGFPWEAHIPTETGRTSTTRAKHGMLEGSDRCGEELNKEGTKRVSGKVKVGGCNLHTLSNTWKRAWGSQGTVAHDTG